MESIFIPFGKSGWEERVRVIEEIIRSRPTPPYIYNDVLVLVPSSRMTRTYGRLFIETVQRMFGVEALVPPQVQTLFQFFDKLSTHSTGPTVIDETSKLVLLEEIIKEHLSAHSAVFGQSPELLAPALSSALSRMIEQLRDAGIAPSALSEKLKETGLDRPAITMLEGVFAEYERSLKKHGVTDPVGLRLQVANGFDPAWLSQYREIIIDGMYDAGEIEIPILKQMASSKKCTFLIESPLPGLLSGPGEYHPLRMTHDFISRMNITSTRNTALLNSDDLFIAESLFSERTFREIEKQAFGLPSFNKEIRLVSAITPREEVSFIAREIKKTLRQGTPADSILVVFPSIDEYGPLVEEIFLEYGIPYNRALGRQLSTSAVTTAVVSLLRAAQEDFSGPSLLRIFSSPLLKYAEEPAIGPELDRFMRNMAITGGKQSLLSALKYHSPRETGTGNIAAPLNDLFAALGPFCDRGAASLSQWMDCLTNLIFWSGLEKRASLVKGPLNINLQAFLKLKEVLSSLGRAGKYFSQYRYTFQEWFFLLKKIFMQARFQVPPDDEGGVQVLGINESVGRAWSGIYFGGLADGTFPPRAPQNIFLPEQMLESMGVRTLERIRLNAAYHFYRLVLSAPKVTLTYPENEADKPVVPSPFLEELTPLRKAGLLNRNLEKTSGIQFSLVVPESNSISEFAKALSVSGNVTGREEVFSSEVPGMAGIREALAYKPSETSSPLVPFLKKNFRVTELDQYLQCPYDYYVTHVLGIEPLEDVTEDISPRERGSKVHEIFKSFYSSWKGPVSAETREEARSALMKLADAAFGSAPDTFRNRREKARFLEVMIERFLDAEEEFWKQGMRPVYLEQMVRNYRLALANGEDVELSAKIDRIDADEQGDFIIVDYKTGRYPLPKMDLEQEIFQLPVYAVMAQQSLPGDTAAQDAAQIRNPIGLAYYDLAGKTGAGARDVVLYDKERRSHPSSKPRASAKSQEEFRVILEQSMAKARKAIEGILAGNFTPSPKDEHRCRYCPNEIMCGIKKL